jgi:Toxin SymE, type I toxin-antitoxin system
MKNKARSLTISSAPTGHPRLNLAGAWMDQFGFTIGDKVSVTPIEPGTIIIKTETPAAVMQHLKTEIQLEQQLQAAEAELHYHRSKPQPCNKPTQP